MSLRARSLIGVVVSATSLAAFVVPGRASASTVATTSGLVEGIDGPSGSEWRGIPYADPPVGVRRWRPPAPVTPWSGVRDATSFASPCIQMASDTETVGSEDCLYLNVFTPSGATADSHLPVMVHLHLGGNFFGAPYTDASAFTSRDVVLVTVAYRLGVFGFMGHPVLTEEGHSGEYGVLDQIAALRWVRDNAAAFGGDPNRVTLFGSSAGSFDAAAIAASPLAEGLIQRAALQGIAFWPLTGVFRTVAATEEFGSFLADTLGCSAEPDPIGCLRDQPADTLVLTAGPDDTTAPVGGPLLPKPPLELLRERSVPLLIGFDREEDAGFHFPFPDPFGQTEWIHQTNAVVGSRLGARARALYPLSAYDSALWSFLTMSTDAVHGCPTRRLANAAASNTTVWRYLYTHVYEDDPFFEEFRAAHVLEDPLLWNADVLGTGHVLTPGEAALSARMTDYWTNFAKDGDPNGDGLPAWPQYDTTDEPVLTLDDTSTVIEGYHRPHCRLMDSLETPYPAPWSPGTGPASDPPGFFFDHARVP